MFTADFMTGLHLFFGEKLVEFVEAEIQAGGEMSHPGLSPLEAGRAEADEVDAPVAAAVNEAGAFEHAEGVSGNGRRRNCETA